MIEYIKKNTLLTQIIVILGLPLLIWALGDAPSRSVFKEFLSILYLLSFGSMLGMFFLNRINTGLVKNVQMNQVCKYHKWIGYFSVGVLLLHPFLLVIPRYFEAGIAPGEAFLTILASVNNPGIVAGIAAWCLLVLIGFTSILRNRLPMRYGAWKIFHGILAIAFILPAAWHVMSLGRHANGAMSLYTIMIAASGVLLVSKAYIRKTSRERV